MNLIFQARKINASTPCETCSESLSSFGGLASLIKFFDIVGFEELIAWQLCKAAEAGSAWRLQDADRDNNSFVYRI